MILQVQDVDVHLVRKIRTSAKHDPVVIQSRWKGLENGVLVFTPWLEVNDAGHVISFELELLITVIKLCCDFGKVIVIDLVAEYVDRDYVKREVFALLEEPTRISRLTFCVSQSCHALLSRVIPLYSDLEGGSGQWHYSFLADVFILVP